MYQSFVYYLVIRSLNICLKIYTNIVSDKEMFKMEWYKELGVSIGTRYISNTGIIGSIDTSYRTFLYPKNINHNKVKTKHQKKTSYFTVIICYYLFVSIGISYQSFWPILTPTKSAKAMFKKGWTCFFRIGPQWEYFTYIFLILTKTMYIYIYSFAIFKRK